MPKKKTSKRNIIVFDYADIIKGHGTAPWHVQRNYSDYKEPIKLEVEAWCVGGAEGIRAYFYHSGYFCTASGDDGNWILMDIMSPDWVKHFKKVVLEIEEI